AAGGADPGQPLAAAEAAAAGAQPRGSARLPPGLPPPDRAARPGDGAVAPRAQGDRYAARGGAAIEGARDSAAALGRRLGAGGAASRVARGLDSVPFAQAVRFACWQRGVLRKTIGIR